MLHGRIGESQPVKTLLTQVLLKVSAVDGVVDQINIDLYYLHACNHT